ncbi:Kinase-like protein [Mycena venus]|nr:Kinase-like protein [Mycena venus]
MLLLLVLISGVTIAFCVLWARHDKPFEFDHNTIDPWRHFRPFLAKHSIALYETPEWDATPRSPVVVAQDAFHPQDTENFCFCVFPNMQRTGSGVWANPTPAIQLALDQKGREVVIKAVRRDSSERDIIERLASSPLRDCPENHTIPVLSILDLGSVTFLVQARWGHCNRGRYVPSLAFWAGTVQHQLLEGLAFMHGHRIAHGDIYPENILWNCREIRSLDEPCPKFEKFKLSGACRMAFVDFGRSVHIPDQVDTCVFGGPDYGPPPPFRAPEIDNGFPFNPFAADVFSIGKVFMHLNPPSEISAAYQDLVAEMTSLTPAARPTARAAF